MSFRVTLVEASSIRSNFNSSLRREMSSSCFPSLRESCTILVLHSLTSSCSSLMCVLPMRKVLYMHIFTCMLKTIKCITGILKVRAQVHGGQRVGYDNQVHCWIHLTTFCELNFGACTIATYLELLPLVD